MTEKDEVFLREFLFEMPSKNKSNRINVTNSIRRFLEVRERLQLNLDEEWLGSYEKEAVYFREVSGIWVDALWLTYHLKYVSYFLNWLLKKGIVKRNPLSRFNQKECFRRMEELCERRREEERSSFREPSGEALLQLYEKVTLKGLLKVTVRRYSKAARAVLDYVESRGKKMSELNEEDKKELMLWMIRIERFPSQNLCRSVAFDYFLASTHFFRWLYEIGCRRDFFFTKEEKNEFLKVFDEEVERRKREVKKRYYTVREILKAYKKYLHKTWGHYSQMERDYVGLTLFIRFILRKRKTLYTADEKTMKAFKTYLMEYEHLPGVYFTAAGQARKILYLKRFFNWFVFHGYRVDNPLKEYRPLSYERAIMEACSKREAGRKICEAIPEAFRKAYEGAERYFGTLNLNPKTVASYKKGWRLYLRYLENAGVTRLEDATEEVLLDYQIYLSEYKNDMGRRFTNLNLFRYLVSLKRFYQYLARFRFLTRDYSLCLKLPKIQTGLPTRGMDDSEVRKLLDKIDTGTPKGIRNRAMIEVLYSTGIRTNELRHLKVKDVSFDEGLVRINVPKGGIRYQRIIPIGEIACRCLMKYLNEVRGPVDKDGESLIFPGMKEKPLSKYAILYTVKSYRIKAGIKKNIVTHSFRVSCATEMLKGKADIKYVQQQLGHTSIQSTEKYLRLMPRDLKEVHKKTHPRERLK